MEERQRRWSGAAVRRVVDRSFGLVPEHAHDWPVLSIFVLGAYVNRTALGEAQIAAPSALLYRAGEPHSNAVGPLGFEQIEIEFDPAWLGRPLPDAPVTRFPRAAAAAWCRPLVKACLSGDEAAARAAVGQFIAGASGVSPKSSSPGWVGEVDRLLRRDPSLRIRELACRVGLHPAWLGAAYRRATGESVADAAARLRVERAARGLRETDEAPARIALEAGFCDQSHMIRTFRRLLGRTPSAVRADRPVMRSPGPGSGSGRPG